MKTKLLLFFLIICRIENASADSFYWVGGSGNWSAYATHWATTSGGSTFQTQVPSSLDDVIFDTNSFSTSGQTVTADQTIIYCKNMDWTGVTNNPSFASADTSKKIKIYGSITLSPNMNIPFNGHVFFESLALGNTIKTFSKVLQCTIDFNGFGGEWKLQDSLSTIKDLKLNFGTVRTNNNNINCDDFYAIVNAPTGLYLGTSTVSINNMACKWQILDTLLVLDADSAIIKLTGNYRCDVSHIGSSITQKYNIIYFSNPVSNQGDYLRMANASIKKIIYNSYGVIQYGGCDLFVDSLFGAFDIYLQTCNSKVNYAKVLGDFYFYDAVYTDTINNLIVSGNAYFGAPFGSNTNHSVIGVGMFLGNITISDGYSSSPFYNNNHKFRNCTIIGDGNILSDTNYFDTLKVSVGRTYTFGSNKTQRINSWFDCFGNPGFPIQLVSNNVGQQATLNFGQNMFCSDYLYMRDMNGTGSPNLFVGANSNNVFNNTGWTFSNCVIGVNEISDFTFNIYPNPFSTQTVLHADNLFHNATLTVDNCFGQTSGVVT